jgi:hypothetical protein
MTRHPSSPPPEAAASPGLAVVTAGGASRPILLIRGQRVMLDSDLAALYGVETRALVQAVKRNVDRFPEDFMFQLAWDEATALWSQMRRSTVPAARGRARSRSQSVILKRGANLKYLPHAFTEQGVAMLSSVLRSPRAVHVNIEVMRTFVRLREILSSHADLARKLAALESKYDAQFKTVFDAIRALMAPVRAPRPKIGFRTGGPGR